VSHFPGAVHEKGTSIGRDQDDVVFISYSACMSRLMEINNLSDVMASAVDEESVPLAKEEITSLLCRRHRVQREEEDDFSIRTQAEIAQATGIMILLLEGIGAVFLLVGGIGIMNIMLVSVTERTREIGIRMVVGAKPSDSMYQFLIEAVMISLIGGFAGILVGICLAATFSALPGWPLIIAWNTIIIVVVVSALIGIIFGVYPARKAAHMDPICAL